MRPSSSNRRLWFSPLLACALSLGGSSGLAASCDLPEQLLDVSISGGARGSVVVRLQDTDDGLQVLVPAELFRASEKAMIGELLTCEDQSFVVPAAGVRIRYDQGAQSLSVSLPAALLGGHVLSLRNWQEPVGTASTPAWGAAFGLAGQMYFIPDPLTQTRPYDARSYVGLGYASNALSVYADVSARRNDPGSGNASSWQVQPRAIARYSLSPNTALTAAWNAEPSVNTPEFNVSTFRGLSLEGQAGFTQRLPDWLLTLPLDAEVEILLDGTSVSRVSVSAGVLTVRDIPVSKVGNHTLKAIINDDNGTREETLNVPDQVPFGVLPGGALLYSAAAGQRDGQWFASANAQYGLSPTFSVQASALLSQAVRSAALSALYVQEHWDAGAGLNYVQNQNTGVTRTGLRLNANLYSGSWRVGGRVDLPLEDIGQGQVAVGVTYNRRNWLISGRYTQGFVPDSWELYASGSYYLNEQAELSASGSVNSAGWRAGVRFGYIFNPQWRTSLQANTILNDYGVSWNVHYTPSPAHTLDLNLLYPMFGSVAYRYSREVEGQIEGNTDGLAAAYLKGAVGFSGGSASLQPVLPQRAILVHTGIPNLPILLNGQQAAVTNAKGDAILVNLSTGRTAEVGVNLEDLPITLSVRMQRQTVIPPVNGLVTLDWRDNFQAYRWVQFRWNDSELAVNADFLTADGKIQLDDQGNGLLLSTATPVTGTLSSQDGTRTCQVTVEAKQEQVQCAATP